ncbi:phosphotransferase family protein [Parapusillimonas sp. SGNA-6]|nr:phosphotransferase family protein [Parapusillimonas sp. SGNA-6]
MEVDGAARALAQFVQDKTHADCVQVVDFHRLSGGAIQSNDALILDCVGGTHPGRLDLVVRSDAPSQIDASLSREQEFQVLNVAVSAGVKAPQALWYCGDPTVIGQPFCVMTRLAGSASGRDLVRGGLSPTQAERLTRDLGVQMARLHQVCPPDERLDFLTLPAPSAALHRVQQYREALADIAEPHPVLEWALNWLSDHAAPGDDVVLCHGDFRTGNYLVHDGALTGILDWEFCAWSDPYEDLGWLCAKSWRFGGAKPVGGIGDKAVLFDAYARESGKLVDARRVLYWEAMAMTRWATIALKQAERHLSGRESSLELALTGRLLPQIEFDLLTHIRELQA